LKPTKDTLVRITAEKNLARGLSEMSLKDLEQAREHLNKKDYDELVAYLELGRDNVEVFHQMNMAMFGCLALKNQNEIDSASDLAAEFRTMTERHVRELQELSDIIEKRYDPDIWPGNPKLMREFAASVTERLD